MYRHIVHVCMGTLLYILYIYIYIYVYIYIYIYVYIYIYIYKMYNNVPIHTCTMCLYIRIYVPIHTYIYIYSVFLKDKSFYFAKIYSFQ